MSSKQWSARVVFSISRREWEFLRFNLVHRDETENSWHLLSGFETRPRKNFLQSRASRRDRDLLSSLSDFETRTRIPLTWSHFLRRDREFWNWISSTFLTGQDRIFHHFFVKIFADIVALDHSFFSLHPLFCNDWLHNKEQFYRSMIWLPPYLKNARLFNLTPKYFLPLLHLLT